MSPEQVTERRQDIDRRSDVYALGITLFECLTLRRPFEGATRIDLYKQILSVAPPDPRRFNPRIPRDVKVIIETALEKDPDRRFQTAEAMADDLHRAAVGEPIRARPVGRVSRLFRWAIRNPVAAALLLAVTVGSAVGFWYLSDLSSQLVRRSAMDSVAVQTDMLNEVNAHYSAKVVDRLKRSGIEVTHDYAVVPGAVPLPATFLTELAARMSKKASGTKVRHFSDFPFRFRKGTGAKDDFDHEALRRLRAKPDEPFYRFEHVDGRYSLRYATARVMKASCVGCHNTHPESTKTDWKAGDVRGVLEIIRPLDVDIERTRAGIRRTFSILGGIIAFLLGASVLLLAVQNRRQGLITRGRRRRTALRSERVPR